jgi:very-short-patch-repair endonuclease
MSFREPVHPKVSAAEIEVFKALSAEGLIGGLLTQKPIILKSTIPDFCWPLKRKVVFLDGRQVHSSNKAVRRDEEIDNLLELQGWDVLRIVYDPPMTAKSLENVMAQIRDFLGETD